MIAKTANGRWRVKVKSKGAVVADRTFDRKGDAELWEAQQKRALSLGDFVDPKAGKESLGDVVTRWMQTREGTVAGSTFKADRNRLRYLPPSLLNRPIAAIRDADLQALLDTLSRRDLSPSSIARVRSLLGALFAWARLNRLVNSDPVKGTRIPSGLSTKEKAEVYPFTAEILRDVVAELEQRDARQASIALVLGLTGLRWGELAALRVRDVVSVPYPAFRVTRSAPDGQEVRTRTKGGRGRTVPLTTEVVPVVAGWTKGKGPDDLVFTTNDGHRLNNSNWRRIVGWSGSCRGRRIHDLRHSAATIWLGLGIDVKTVQTWMGHQSAQLTLDLYGHFRGTDADTAAIARVNAGLSGDATGTQVPNLRAAKSRTS